MITMPLPLITISLEEGLRSSPLLVTLHSLMEQRWIFAGMAAFVIMLSIGLM